MSVMEPEWPLYVPRRSPVSVSHTVGVLSLAAEKSRSPSRLKTTRVMLRSWPFITMTRCTGWAVGVAGGLRRRQSVRGAVGPAPLVSRREATSPEPCPPPPPVTIPPSSLIVIPSHVPWLLAAWVVRRDL